MVDIFVDSGAHSLYTQEVIKKKHQKGYSYFESDEFWKYVDDYAEFIKKYKNEISVYVNVDVIFNPELSWEVQQYLENNHGLKPLPVIHYGTDFKWLEHYLSKDYEYIGLGGIGQEVNIRDWSVWGDRAFSLICDTEDRLPKVKVHGFAMTSLRAMLRYPWYSVDSTTWVTFSRFGVIMVPRYQGRKWIYDENCWNVAVSIYSSKQKELGKHLKTFSPKEQELIISYIQEKGFKLGKSSHKREPLDYELKENEKWSEKKKDVKGNDREVEIIEEHGVCNDYRERDMMNAMYFNDLQKTMQSWPWPFSLNKTIQSGFGL